jgi:hypothetical protein
VSWLFSQALVEAFLAARCSVGEPFAQLNVMPTAQPFWRNAKPMDACRFSRFGLTLRVLTAAHGEALLMWFRAAFLVRTSVSQDPATDSMANAPASGVRWLALFARWDRDTSSWKTAQCSLLEEFTGFSQTWPSSGSMLNGECWERPTLERRTSDDESGFLPTPVTLDSGSRFNRSQSNGAQLRPTLGAMARFNLWPTPTCGGGGQTVPEGTSPHGATPDGRKVTVCLEKYVQQVEHGLWPTPTVRGNYNRKGLSSKSGDGLATAVLRFPTPTVAMRKGSSIGALTRRSGRSRANDRLDYRLEGSGLTGRLNPTWVEWLMGWPIGWTALQPLEMDRFHEWRQQHGNFSFVVGWGFQNATRS